eukprot:10428279-Ditylum_brightwellii.AAC.1
MKAENPIQDTFLEMRRSQWARDGEATAAVPTVIREDVGASAEDAYTNGRAVQPHTVATDALIFSCDSPRLGK